MKQGEIKPAMTAEEWEAQLARSPGERRRALLHARDEADAGGYLTIHGLAALALHDQPFGFTREDVGLLRGEALDMDTSLDYPDRIRDLADRIEALLAPEQDVPSALATPQEAGEQ